jgi:hypothetical protein
MHLDEERLQRLLHGELPRSEAEVARDHASHCDACSTRLNAAATAEAEIFALFAQVDHEVPSVSAEWLARKAGGPGTRWWSMRWAAGILLLVGLAGGAYAATNPHLRGWVRSATAWLFPPEVVQRAPRRTHASADQTGGIAAAPGRQFVISFTRRDSEAEARVTLTDKTQVIVRASQGTASFTSSAAGLQVDNFAVGANFEIEVPQSAPRLEILVAGTRIFLKEGAQVSTTPRADADGSFSIPFPAP